MSKIYLTITVAIHLSLYIAMFISEFFELNLFSYEYGFLVLLLVGLVGSFIGLKMLNKDPKDKYTRFGTIINFTPVILQVMPGLFDIIEYFLKNYLAKLF